PMFPCRRAVADDSPTAANVRTPTTESATARTARWLRVVRAWRGTSRREAETVTRDNSRDPAPTIDARWGVSRWRICAGGSVLGAVPPLLREPRLGERQLAGECRDLRRELVHAAVARGDVAEERDHERVQEQVGATPDP